MITDDHSLYSIALSMIPGIGSKTARKLISLIGSPEQIFREERNTLIKVPGVGNQLVAEISNSDNLIKAEKEISTLMRHDIQILHFTDPAYPENLNDCPDGPILLYTKGKTNLNHDRILSIVGTRSPTAYGTEVCRKLISVAVLGHGLGFLYPGAHRPVARKILESGSLITDFAYGEKPERQNFIKRNRIIAGISNATIVIESGTRGGALLTAQMAGSYNRDVMAIPGKSCDPMSSGCNNLIKEHKATMIEGWQDVKYFMGWDDAPEETIQCAGGNNSKGIIPDMV